MSCKCDLDNQLAGPLESAFIVLTRNDLYKVRIGKVLQNHFHGNNLDNGRMTFFVSNEKNIVHKGSKLGKAAMLLGDVVPIVIHRDEMTQIMGDKIMSFTVDKNPIVSVHVMSGQTYHKMILKVNKKESQSPPDPEKEEFLKSARSAIVEKHDQEKNS